MRLYHSTTATAAARILRGGFRDSDAIPSLGIGAVVRGFTDVPTRHATTHDGEVILAVDVPDATATAHLVPGSPGEFLGRSREFCIPAEILNRYPRANLVPNLVPI